MRTKRFSSFEIICNLAFIFFVSLYTVYSLHFAYPVITCFDIPTTMDIVKLWLFAFSVFTLLIFSTRLGCMLYFNTIMAEPEENKATESDTKQVVLQLELINGKTEYMTIFIPKSYSKPIRCFIEENNIVPTSVKNYYIQWKE